MKKHISNIIFLALILTLFIFAFASCGKDDPIPAEMPTLTYDETGISISSALEGVSFKYKIDDGEWIALTGVKLDSSSLLFTAGEHTVSVKVDAENSLVAQISYEVKNLALSDLTVDGTTISFTSVGSSLSYKKGDGEFQALSGSPLTITEPGSYTVKVESSVDLQNRVIYYGNAIEKTVVVESTALTNPVLSVVDNAIVWEAVDGATGYQVKVNDGEFAAVENRSVALATEAGSYTVVVKAQGDAFHTESEASYTYTVKAVSLTDPVVTDNSIAWTAEGFVSVKVDDGDFAAPQSAGSFVMTKPGTLTIKVEAGFDAENKILYVGQAVEKTASVVTKALGNVTLTPNLETGLISYTTVEHAVSYTVKVDGTAQSGTEQSHSVALPTTLGKHTITVQAAGDGISYGVSEVASFEYEIKATTLKLEKSTYTVSWTGDALSFQIKTGSSFETTTNTSYYTNQNGTVTIKAVGGWDSKTNTFYYGNKEEAVVFAFSDSKVIENANEAEVNADLAENWTIEYFNNAWVTPSAKVNVVLTDSFTKENGNAMLLNFFNNGYSFKFSTKIDQMPFNVVSFDVKGNGISDISIRFEITGKANYPGTDISLTGIYCTYKMTAVDKGWQKVSLAFDDENWKINFAGTDMTIPELIAIAKKNYGVDIDFAQIAQYFDTFDIIGKGSTSNGASASVIFDNITIGKVSAPKTEFAQYLFNAATKYTAEKDGVVYQVLITGKDTCILKSLNLEENISVNMTYVLSGNNFVLDYTEGSTSVLNLTAAIGGNGSSLTVTKVGGAASATYAPVLQGLVFNSIVVVDNFDSYTATGTGIDGNNQDPSKLSGIRANYFGEYYDGTSTSPLSGKGWKLIGATDYLTLVTGESGNSMKLRSFSGGSAKYITLANVATKLSSGTVSSWATSYGSGTTLSIWVKGSEKRNVIFKIAPIYEADLANNAVNELTYSAETTIEAGADFTHFEFTLDPTKELFGFAIIVKNGSSDTYIEVDNIELYSANPYAEYVDPVIDLSKYPDANVLEDFSSYSPSSGGAVQPNTNVFSKSGSAGFYVRNDSTLGYGDSKYMTFQYVNSSTLRTNTLIYTLAEPAVANYVGFAIANDRNANAVQAEIVVKVYDVNGKIVSEGSFTIEKGETWSEKQFIFASTAVAKVSIQVNAATASSGDGYMKFDNIIIKKDIPKADVFLTFDDGTSGSAYSSSNWAQTQAGNKVSGQMNCRTDADGDKVVNVVAGNVERQFTYSEEQSLGLANTLSVRIGNYHTSYTINCKVYLTTAKGETIYVVGSADAYVPVASTGTGSTNKVFTPMSFDFDAAEIVSITIAVKISESNNAYLYLDDIHLFYTEASASE